jgi:hypothetical protein
MTERQATEENLGLEQAGSPVRWVPLWPDKLPEWPYTTDTVLGVVGNPRMFQGHKPFPVLIQVFGKGYVAGGEMTSTGIKDRYTDDPAEAMRLNYHQARAIVDRHQPGSFAVVSVQQAFEAWRKYGVKGNPKPVSSMPASEPRFYVAPDDWPLAGGRKWWAVYDTVTREKMNVKGHGERPVYGSERLAQKAADKLNKEWAAGKIEVVAEGTAENPGVGMSAAQDALKRKRLGGLVRTTKYGVIGWGDYVKRQLEAGGSVELVEYRDHALRKKLEAEYERMNRGFNIPWGNASHPKTIVAQALKDRLAGEITSPQYRLIDPDDPGAYTVINKTLYDYGMELQGRGTHAA